MPRFEKGNPGGPGRPRGSTLAFELLDRLGEENAQKLFDAVMKQASEGKPQAANILAARLWPIRRGRPVHLALPPIKDAKDLLAAQAVVAEALGAGELTPQEAMEVSKVLEKHRVMLELVEAQEKAKRLEAEAKEREEKRQAHRAERLRHWQDVFARISEPEPEDEPENELAGGPVEALGPSPAGSRRQESSRSERSDGPGGSTEDPVETSGPSPDGSGRQEAPPPPLPPPPLVEFVSERGGMSIAINTRTGQMASSADVMEEWARRAGQAKPES